MLQVFKIFLKAVFRKKSIALYLFLCMLAILISTYSVVNIKDVISVKVEGSLKKYNRPLYDILVRPKGSISPVEKKYEIVEGNFIQETSNKISVTEYEKIKSIGGVKFAAPVAPLGYVPNNMVDISIYLPLKRDEIMVSSEESFITDGVRKFINYSTKHLGSLETNSAGTFEGKKYVNEGVVLPFPAFFVVGIEPAEENSLCGVKKAILKGNYLDTKKPFYMSYRSEDSTLPDVLLAPAIVASGAYNNCFSQQTLKRYPESVLSKVGADRLPEDLKKEIKIWRLLQDVKPLEQKTFKFSIKDVVPFRRTQYIYINENLFKADLYSLLYNRPPYTWKGKTLVKPYREGDEINFSLGTGEIFPDRIIITQPANYRLTHKVKSWKGLEFSPVPIDKRNDDPYFVVKAVYGPLFEAVMDDKVLDDAPIYRETTVVSTFEFQIVPVGKIDLDKVSASHQDLENWVPLGMYIPPETKLLFDVKGNPLKETEIYPVDDPRMLLLNSPLCFIDYRAVAKLRGKKCITAIRIKCETEDKIDDIIRKIKKIGDYDINVVYGSSPQKILIGDLDYKGAKGLGYFVQLWTTLGANVKLKALHQRFKTLLIVLNLVVLVSLCVIYSMFYLTGLATERKYMEKIEHTRSFKMMLFAAFSLLPFFISTLVLLALSIYLGKTSEITRWLEIYRNLSAYFIAFIMFSFFIVYLTENRSSKLSTRLLKRLPVKSVVAAALKSETGSLSLLLSQIIIFAISQATIVLTVTSIYYIARNYNFLILGERILKENITNYIILLVSAFLMIIIASIASTVIRSKRYEKEAAFLKAIGWKRNQITRYVGIIEVTVLTSGFFAALFVLLLILRSALLKDPFFIFAVAMSGFFIPALIHLQAMVRIFRRIDSIEPFKNIT